MRFRKPGRMRARIIVLAALAMLTAAAPLFLTRPTEAALLTYRQLRVSDGTVSTPNVRYEFSFNTITSGPIGSLKFSICSNYMYESTDPCTAPNGFDASAATISNQAGVTDLAIHPASDDHTLILTRPAPAIVAPQQLTVEFSGITNPSDVGSYYVLIETHMANDASDAYTDYGNVVFAMNQSVDIETEVPPYLLFCTGISIQNYDCTSAEGSFISFGELSRSETRAASSQMVAATNAPYGYSVTLAGTTMTAGTHIIPAMTGQASQKGVSQFGINSRLNTSPGVGSEPVGPGLTVPSAGYNTPNIYRFGSGDIIASNANTDDYRKLTVSYIVNINSGQPPGRYVATVSYICLANF